MTRALPAAIILFCCAALSACSKPLPEEGSPDAVLYASRCGGCHPVYQPHAMTPTMWKLQVDRMDQKYREVGRPIPTGEERQRILDYLTRNAGG